MALGYYEATAQRARAHSIAAKAIREGRLVRPSACSRCGSPHRRIEGHHPDYSKPLEVVWLCAGCHRREHHGTGSLVPPPTVAEVRNATRRRYKETPRPLREVAAELGVSASTLRAWVGRYGLTKYTVPGGGKTVHLDPDEVRRKRRHRPKPVEES